MKINLSLWDRRRRAVGAPVHVHNYFLAGRLSTQAGYP